MSKDNQKKDQIASDLARMRKRIAELESSEVKRKQTETALKDSEEKYKSLTNQLPIGVYRTTKKGKILYANPAFASILEFDNVKDLMKSSAINLYDDPKDRVKQLEQWKARGGIVCTETQFRTKKGAHRWIKDTGRIILDRNGEIDYIDGTVEDITARKQAEEELIATSEELTASYEELEAANKELMSTNKALDEKKTDLESLFSAIDDMLTVVDPKFNILQVNKTTLNWLGVKSEKDLIGKKCYSAFHMRKSICPDCPIKQTLKTKKATSIEKMKMGLGKYLHVNASPVFNNSGEIVKVIEVARDITEHKQAEEAFHTEKAYLDRLIESAQEAIVIADKNHKVLRVNREFTRLFGYTPKEAIGQSIDNLVASRKLLKDARFFTKQLSKGKRVAFENFRQRKDGTLIHVSAIGAPIKVDNKYVAYYAIYRNITAQKKAEEALKTEKAYLDQLFESAQEAIVMSDINHRILRVNKEFTRLFGYMPDEAIGQSIDDLVAPKDFYNSAVSITKKVAKGESAAFEAIRQRKNGILINVSVLASPIILNDKPIAVYGIYRDITARKRTENKMLYTLETLRKAMKGTIQAIALTVETRDPYTYGHHQRVTDLARAIATEMGLSKDKIEGIRLAGQVHDIGKISVPAEILSRSGELNEFEFDMIKTHPQVGHNILRQIKFPWPVAKTVLQHHERIDGFGYPSGLSGDEISIEAKILAVADVVEAIASHRPHRPALGIDKALEEISKNKGVLYDPEVVDACLKLFKKKKYNFQQEEETET